MRALVTERVQQLLADRATEGLGKHDVRELDRMIALTSEADKCHFDMAASVIDIALSRNSIIAIPSTLRDRLLIDAGSVFGRVQGGPTLRDQLGPKFNERQRGNGRRVIAWSGWLAAAACLILAVAAWWTTSAMQSAGRPNADGLYANSVAKAPDALQVSLVGRESGFERVSGGLLWSDSRQSGCMKFIGMPVNDPRTAQYQLWIVDPARDQNPVDGGVFDVPVSGEVTIPFEPKLPVHHPKVFAITREKPGGVVVSRGPLLVAGSEAADVP